MNIVITGASKGVGYYTALNLAKKKEYKIFALSRDVPGLKKLSESVDSGNIITIPCDLTDEKSINESVQKIRRNASSIEVLINNAGLLIKKPFLELTSADWQAVYNVNVFGVVNITRAILPLLLEGSISKKTNVRSHIVNISSMGGVQGSVKFSGLSAYSSSKSALIGISECLSEEYKAEGVCVNSIALGYSHSKKVHIEIFNTIGEIIYSEYNKSFDSGITNKINLNAPSGIYLIKVNDGEKQFTGKLIVE